MSKEKQPTPPNLKNGGGPAACTTATCPNQLKNAMSEAEAQAFMDEFKKTDIPFDYPPDCCYARARVMADIMKKKGVASEKLWSEGALAAHKPNGDVVTFPDEYGNPAPVTWHYHVAPIVNVEQPNGSIERRILDPSLSDRPITVDAWKALCGVSSSDTIDKITPPNEHYPFSPITAGKDYSVSEANAQLQDHKASRDSNRAAANKSK